MPSHDNIVPTAKLRQLLHPEVDLERVKHLLLTVSEIQKEEKVDREKEIIGNFAQKRCILNFKLQFFRCASLKDDSYYTIPPSINGILQEVKQSQGEKHDFFSL